MTLPKHTMKIQSADILIVGAGIIGLTIAKELVRQGWENIVIIDKESDTGKHASGRNSGVLHAGIYYAPDSMKAKSCLNGNLLMRRYCRENGLPILETGKVVVARNDSELPVLQTLYERAVANGAKVDLLTPRELTSIEPNAKTVSTALYSHFTAVVDPKKVLSRLKEDLESSKKVRFEFHCAFLALSGSRTARTSRGDIAFSRLINAAGAGCERVAQAFGVGNEYRLIPFKGIYYRLKKSRSDMIRGSIYPVPDIRNPFLGVHFTRNVYGEVYVGPTAIPALGRENYGILQGIDSEMPEILYRDAALFLTNPKFRNVAMTEPRKYFFPFFFRDASALVHHLDPSDLEPTHKVGIRPQLVHWMTKELVMDFLVLRKDDSIHVLNPISPAFTSSMDLASQTAAMLA